MNGKCWDRVYRRQKKLKGFEMRNSSKRRSQKKIKKMSFEILPRSQSQECAQLNFSDPKLVFAKFQRVLKKIIWQCKKAPGFGAWIIWPPTGLE